MTWNGHMWSDIELKFELSSWLRYSQKSHQIIILLCIIGLAHRDTRRFHSIPLLSNSVSLRCYIFPFFTTKLYIIFKILCFCSPFNLLSISPPYLSSVWRVVLKSKWTMIIKWPICLMLFPTLFPSLFLSLSPFRSLLLADCVSERTGQKAYHAYITFITVFLRIFILLLRLCLIFGLPIVCVGLNRRNGWSSLPSLCLWCEKAKRKMFLMFKQLNRMKNTFGMYI